MGVYKALTLKEQDRNLHPLLIYYRKGETNILYAVIACEDMYAWYG